MTQKEILEQVLSDISAIKKGLPNGEVTKLLEKVGELKEDVSELKRLLLNPEDGVVVKTNKNTEFRLEREKKATIYEAYVQDLLGLVKWKEGVNKALWIIFGAIIAIAIRLIMIGPVDI